MQKYYLAKDGKQVGPFTVSEILSKVSAQEHTWSDYIFETQKNDWVMLFEHPELSVKFNETFKTPPPKLSPKEEGLNDLKERAWYVLKEGNNYGPFSKLELIQMLQSKTLFEYDFIWHQTYEAWKRVADVKEFSVEAIRDLKKSDHSEVAEVFFRRRHLRSDYNCSLIVHDSKHVFKGNSIQLSVGGAGISIPHPNFQLGQSVYLHFKPGDGVPPFNAVCQIVSKQFVDVTQNSSKDVNYGIKFVKLSPSTREQIQKYTEKKVA